MELKRDIYKKLLEWKQDDSGKVLQVSGARQVGKTHILNKFADENFKHSIYISMAEVTGERFIMCLDQAEEWKPGTPMEGEPVHEAVRLFYPAFEDSKDTVLLLMKYRSHPGFLIWYAHLPGSFLAM